MDIQKALNELYEEKKRLDWTISTLEARLKKVSSVSRSRRGRKSMGGRSGLRFPNACPPIGRVGAQPSAARKRRASKILTNSLRWTLSTRIFRCLNSRA